MTSTRPDPQQPTARPEQPAADRPTQTGSLRAEQAQVSEPARVRALAHPLRTDLLDYLGEVGEATATEYIDRLRRTDPAHLHPVVDELTSLTTASFWATEQEAADLLATLGRLTEPFAGRTEDPAARPDGTRFMRWFSAANPDLDVAPRSSAPHPAAPQED